MNKHITHVLTQQGLFLLNRLQFDAELVITKAMAGSGYSDNLEYETQLQGPIAEMEIVQREMTEDGMARISVRMTNEEMDQTALIRQIGIYAEDPDEGEILYQLLQFEVPQPIPSREINRGAIACLECEIDLVMSNSGYISVNTTPGWLLRKEDMADHDTASDSHADMRGELAELGDLITDTRILLDSKAEQTDIEAHNENTIAHRDIREAITDAVAAHNTDVQAHEGILVALSDSLEAHDEDPEAHMDLREDVAGLKEHKADQAALADHNEDEAAHDDIRRGISEIRAEIDELKAGQDAGNGNRLIGVADDGLEKIQAVLEHMRAFAVQADSSSDGDADREQIAKEVQALKQDIDRIALSTNYDEIKLLDGSLGACYGRHIPGRLALNGTDFYETGSLRAIYDSLYALGFSAPNSAANGEITRGCISLTSYLGDFYNRYANLVIISGDDGDGEARAALQIGDKTYFAFVDTSSNTNYISIDGDLVSVKQGEYAFCDEEGRLVATLFQANASADTQGQLLLRTGVSGVIAGIRLMDYAVPAVLLEETTPRSDSTKAIAADHLLYNALIADCTQKLTFRIDANGTSYQNVELQVRNMTTACLGTMKASDHNATGSIHGIDVSTRAAAGAAISCIDAAIGQVADQRTELKRAQDALIGSSLVRTAENGADRIYAILDRMRTLAVQAENSMDQDADREQIAGELQALKRDIDRIALSTGYNKIKLLDGSLGAYYGRYVPGGEIDNGTYETGSLTAIMYLLQKLGFDQIEEVAFEGYQVMSGYVELVTLTNNFNDQYANLVFISGDDADGKARIALQIGDRPYFSEYVSASSPGNEVTLTKQDGNTYKIDKNSYVFYDKEGYAVATLLLSTNDTANGGMLNDQGVSGLISSIQLENSGQSTVLFETPTLGPDGTELTISEDHPLYNALIADGTQELIFRMGTESMAYRQTGLQVRNMSTVCLGTMKASDYNTTGSIHGIDISTKEAAGDAVRCIDSARQQVAGQSMALRAVAEVLGESGSGKTDLAAHNEDPEAHADLRALIAEAGGGDVDAHNTDTAAHSDIRTALNSKATPADITTHNTSTSAHSDIRNSLTSHNTDTAAHNDIRTALNGKAATGDLAAHNTNAAAHSDIRTALNSKATPADITTHNTSTSAHSDIRNSLTAHNTDTAAHNDIRTALNGKAATGDLTAHNTNTSAHSDIRTALNGKAPTSHASTGTGYGAANASNYGHVRLSDSAPSSLGAGDGYAATPYAVSVAYYKGTEIQRQVFGNSIGIGPFALQSGVGNNCTAVGYGALRNNSGSVNAAFGADALNTNSGYGNTAVGNSASYNNTGNYNTSCGHKALYNSQGGNNCAVGYEAVCSNTTGYGNVAIGSAALMNNTTGGLNNAIGMGALQYIVNGRDNSAIGFSAGAYYINGNTMTSSENVTCVGYYTKASGNNQVQLGDANATVYAQKALQVRSDRRDKKEISELKYDYKSFILGLKPSQFIKDPREAYHTIDRISEEEYNALSEAEQKEWRKAPPERAEDGTEVIFYEKSYNKPNDGTKAGKRFHNGFIAQEVKELADSLDFDFAGYQDHSVNGGCDVLSIGYEEFIAPMVATIQDLSAENEALTKKTDDLQRQLDELKALITAK